MLMKGRTFYQGYSKVNYKLLRLLCKIGGQEHRFYYWLVLLIVCCKLLCECFLVTMIAFQFFSASFTCLLIVAIITLQKQRHRVFRVRSLEVKARRRWKAGDWSIIKTRCDWNHVFVSLFDWLWYSTVCFFVNTVWISPYQPCMHDWPFLILWPCNFQSCTLAFKIFCFLIFIITQHQHAHNIYIEHKTSAIYVL